MKEALRKWSAGLARTRQAVTGRLAGLAGGQGPETWDAIEETLVGADLGIELAASLIDKLKDRARRDGWVQAEQVRAGLREELCRLMVDGGRDLHLGASPAVITVVGVNGVGKTTTIGKLAHRLVEDGRRVLVGASDTFRAGAIDQLREWAHRAGAAIISQEPGADPAAVAFDALKAARARGYDVLIIDTAGRLHTKRNLMEELKKVHRILGREMEGAPHEVLLVLDATTGQNALPQARLFGEAVGVTGLVLTKLDGTARGGMAVAVESGLGIPVKLAGLGEGIDDLEPFDPASFLDAMFQDSG